MWKVFLQLSQVDLNTVLLSVTTDEASKAMSTTADNFSRSLYTHLYRLL